MPDCIEDELLTKLSDLVMGSFTQQNPIRIDLTEAVADEVNGASSER